MRFKTAVSKAVAAALFIAAFSGSLAVGADTAQPLSNFIKPGPRTSDEVAPLRCDRDKAMARFPVTLEGAQANEITLKVIDVLLDNQGQSNLISAFKPKMEPTLEGRGPAILIEVDLNCITEQGKYLLTIQANKDKARPVPIELQVVLPLAKARVPRPLVVERVLPFFSIDPEVKGSMKLEELSKRVWLTDIEIIQFDKGAGEDGLPVSGEVVFTTNGMVIEPSKTQCFDYNLKGDFPLGITRGIVEVKSPQLAESLPINFEVKSRVSRWVIFLFILIGLVFGWLVRIVLQRRIELNGIKLQGIELEKLIIKEMDRRPDEEFRTVMNEALAELEVELNAGDAARLKTIITKVNTALTDALADLKKRKEEARAKLEGLQKLVEFRNLPKAIAATLDIASARIDDANGNLNKDNVKEADRQAEAIRPDLGESLAAPIREWRTSLIAYLDELGRDDVLLPASVVPDLKLAITTVKPLLAQVSDVDSQKTTVEIEAVLKNIGSASANVKNLLSSLQVMLQNTLNKTTALLPEALIPDKPAVERLKENLGGFKVKLDGVPDSPQIAFDELQSDLKSLHNAWSEASLNQIPVDHPDRPGVEKLIQDRDYLSAANKVAEILKSKLDEASLKDTPGLGASAATGGMSIWPTLEVSGLEPVFIIRREVEEEPRDPLVVQEARTRMQLLKDSLLRNFLVALLVTLVGYLMFADKFVGTIKDVAQVFFWAFTIDITVEVLVQSAKGLRGA